MTVFYMVARCFSMIVTKWSEMKSLDGDRHLAYR
jgi:hypothetical protein